MAEVKQPVPIIFPGNASAKNTDITASLTFRLFSDNRLTDDGLAVLLFTSVPPLGSPYSFRGNTYYNLRAKNYNPQYVGNWGSNGGIWDVEVTYDNAGSGDDPPDPSETDPFTITPRMEKIEMIMDIDLDGILVTNSAGQQFESPPMMEFPYPIFSISRTEYSNPCRRLMQNFNCVNSMEFWGYPPGRVCLLDMSPTTSVSWGAPSWSVTYDIGVNPYVDIDIWQQEMLDAGTFERHIVTDEDDEEKKYVELRAITDVDGKEIETPVKLDGNGKKLPEVGTPVWLQFRKRMSADLNLLNLPNPFLV